MRVLVTGPGLLSLSGKRVQSVSRHVSKKGKLYLTVTPSAALKEVLVDRGVAHVTVNVKFTPDSGPGRVKVKKMGLVLNG